MSQYLNIYLKPKDNGKPKYLTCYSRNSDVYGRLVEDGQFPFYNSEEYGTLSCEFLRYICDDIKKQIADEQERTNLRMKAIKDVSNKEVAETFIEEIESLNRCIKEDQETLKEVEHLYWLAYLLNGDQEWEFAEYEGLVGNIN